MRNEGCPTVTGAPWSGRFPLHNCPWSRGGQADHALTTPPVSSSWPWSAWPGRWSGQGRWMPLRAWTSPARGHGKALTASPFTAHSTTSPRPASRRVGEDS